MADKKDLLFGKSEIKLLTDPFNDNNPITVQVLGVCSALAVTSLAYKAIVMSVAVIFVVAASNVITSLMRKLIPSQIRMIVQLVIIATLVTIVELTLKAASFSIYKELSVYIGLIITNCIVMGRLEAFALKEKPWRSFLDGIGNGAGYGAILIMVAVVREIFGKGTLFAGSPMVMNIIGKGSEFWINTDTSFLFGWYQSNNLMVMPASALFIIAIFIWIQRSMNPKLVDVS